MAKIGTVFQEIAENLRKKADEKFNAASFKARSLKDLEKHLGEGICSAGWCGEKRCAEKIEESCSILSVGEGKADCVVCGKPGKEIKAAKTY